MPWVPEQSQSACPEKAIRQSAAEFIYREIGRKTYLLQTMIKFHALDAQAEPAGIKKLFDSQQPI